MGPGPVTHGHGNKVYQGGRGNIVSSNVQQVRQSQTAGLRPAGAIIGSQSISMESPSKQMDYRAAVSPARTGEDPLMQMMTGGGTGAPDLTFPDYNHDGINFSNNAAFEEYIDLNRAKTWNLFVDENNTTNTGNDLLNIPEGEELHAADDDEEDTCNSSFIERHQAWVDVLDENLKKTRKNPAEKEASGDFDFDVGELLTAVEDIIETTEQEGKVGTKTLFLDSKLFAEGIRQLQNQSLIIHTVDLRVNMAYFERWAEVTLHQLLGVNIVNICQLDPFCFHMTVDSGKACAHIFANSPLKMGNKMVFPLPWDTKFCTKDLKSRAVPVWLELYNVHPGLLKFGLNMLRMIGPIIYVAKNTETQRINVIRGCVLMDLSKDLPEFVPIAVSEAPDLIMKQKIRYLRLPDACFICRQRGHFAKNCALNVGRPQGNSAGGREDTPRQGNNGDAGRAANMTGTEDKVETADPAEEQSKDGEGSAEFKAVRRRGKPKFQTPEIKKTLKVDNRYGILEEPEERPVVEKEQHGPNWEVIYRERIRVENTQDVNQGAAEDTGKMAGSKHLQEDREKRLSSVGAVTPPETSGRKKLRNGDEERTATTASDWSGRKEDNRPANEAERGSQKASREFELEKTLARLAEVSRVTVDYSTNGWGGSALVIKPSIEILSTGVKGDGRVAWAKINTCKGPVGVMSIYSPHSKRERMELWWWIKRLMGQEQWIITGDLNMVVRCEDTNCVSPLLKGDEVLTWLDLCQETNIVDCYDETAVRTGSRFTRFQIKGGTVEMSRLDRMYISGNGDWVDLVSKIQHDAKAGVSDHCPLVVDFKLRDEGEETRWRKSYMKIAVTNLLDAGTRERGCAAWHNHPRNVEDPRIRWELAWRRVKTVVKAARKEKKQKEINREDLAKELFTDDGETEEDVRERRECLDFVNRRVEAGDNTILEWEPTEQEVANCVQNLAREKAPGLDGISANVLRLMWDDAKDLCMQMLLAFWHDQQLPTTAKRGVIKLIAKNEEKFKLTNWRPITLTWITYKLASKLIADRIKPLLPKLVSRQQTGFIPATGQEAIFLKLDFVKAYDRVRHSFFWDTLEKMGFSPKVIRLVHGLMQDASATKEKFGPTLGTPVGVNVAEDQLELYLLEKLTRKVNHWSNRMLTWEGRSVVLKHALATMPNYCLMTLGLTSKGYNKLDKICWQFLWGSNGEGNFKKPLIGWGRICRDKSEGGLGLCTFKDQAATLKMRLVVRLIEEEDTSWIRLAEKLIGADFTAKKKTEEMKNDSRDTVIGGHREN
ncbi:hypothetical protein R1sor_003511 [Riccia sorocarpa]|uniref:CCHC-type domain-containing protein n=1 Tax=Riccia sorocarpa TaxID=122646 RepID=A0ABD3H7Z3_9MARC